MLFKARKVHGSIQSIPRCSFPFVSENGDLLSTLFKYQMYQLNSSLCSSFSSGYRLVCETWAHYHSMNGCIIICRVDTGKKGPLRDKVGLVMSMLIRSFFALLCTCFAWPPKCFIKPLSHYDILLVTEKYISILTFAQLLCSLGINCLITRASQVHIDLFFKSVYSTSSGITDSALFSSYQLPGQFFS